MTATARLRPLAILAAFASGALCLLAGVGYLGVGWFAGYGRNAGAGTVMMLGSPLCLLGPGVQAVLLARGRYASSLVIALLSALLAIASLALLGPLLFGMANP